MNNSQYAVIKLLSCYINKQESCDINWEEFDLEAVYNIAMIHDVLPLIYKPLNKFAPAAVKNQDLFRRINLITIQRALTQANHIQNLKYILKSFSNENISVILLKGLVLKDLYPDPELRTMSDADILVKKEDFSRARAILEKLSYFDVGHYDLKHIHMEHEKNMPVELHWSLLDKSRHEKDVSLLEEEIWDRVRVVKDDAHILSLSLEDNLLHLILHMSNHFFATGVGIRQICDIVVFIQSYYDELNWEKVWINICDFKVKIFASVILLICNKYFNSQIPCKIMQSIQIEDVKVQKILTDILEGGAFGGSTVERRTTNRLTTYFKENSAGRKQKIKTILNFVFPTSNSLGDEYRYAREQPLLLPLAWIHRVIYNIIRRDRNKMINSLIRKNNRSSLDLARERFDLVKWIKQE